MRARRAAALAFPRNGAAGGCSVRVSPEPGRDPPASAAPTISHRRCASPGPALPATPAAVDELATNDERLGKSFGTRLRGVAEADAQLRAIAQQRLETGEVLGRGDDKDVTDTSQHEGGQGVVDHRLVVHRQELLAGAEGERVEPGAGSAGKDDALACPHVVGLGVGWWVREGRRCKLAPKSRDVKALVYSHAKESPRGWGAEADKRARRRLAHDQRE